MRHHKIFWSAGCQCKNSFRILNLSSNNRRWRRRKLSVCALSLPAVFGNYGNVFSWNFRRPSNQTTLIGVWTVPYSIFNETSALFHAEAKSSERLIYPPTRSSWITLCNNEKQQFIQQYLNKQESSPLLKKNADSSLTFHRLKASSRSLSFRGGGWTPSGVFTDSNSLAIDTWIVPALVCALSYALLQYINQESVKWYQPCASWCYTSRL